MQPRRAMLWQLSESLPPRMGLSPPLPSDATPSPRPPRIQRTVRCTPPWPAQLVKVVIDLYVRAVRKSWSNVSPCARVCGLARRPCLAFVLCLYSCGKVSEWCCAASVLDRFVGFCFRTVARNLCVFRTFRRTVWSPGRSLEMCDVLALLCVVVR